MSRTIDYNKVTVCERIKEDGNTCGNKFHHDALKEYDNQGKPTGKYICRKCR